MGLFSRKTPPSPSAHSPTPSVPEVSLDFLATSMFENLDEMENQDVDLDLLRARLADHYRDMERAPMSPDVFMEKAEALSTEERQRLAILIDGLDDEEFREAYACVTLGSVEEQVEACFLTVARDLELLTPEVLLQSALRREEMVRFFMSRIGLRIVGEKPQDSAKRLARLDYGKLLAAADRAKSSAEERMAYLRELQEKQEKLLGRRGKI